LLIAELHADSVDQRTIATKLGISQSQVCRDLKEIYARFAEPDKTKLRVYRSLMLAAVRSHRKRCLRLLAESEKPREVTSQKQVKTRQVAGEGDAAQVKEKERHEVSLRTEGQVGNPAFLKSIEWSIEQECKLRGLYAPQQIEQESSEPLRIIEIHEVTRNDGDDATTDGGAGTGTANGPNDTGGSGHQGLPAKPGDARQGVQINLVDREGSA
jgi:hypothetical protein